MIELSSPEIERVIKLYAKSKKIIIECEEFDEFQQSNISVLVELRSAFDHIMRCISNNFLEKPNDEDQKKQIDEAIMHIVRATCDSLGGLAISVFIRITEKLKNISPDVIGKVFPEYYSKYTNKIRTTKDEIYEYTSKKKEILSMEDMDNLIEKIKELKKINQEIEEHLPDMVKAQKENKRGFIWQIIIIGLIFLGVGFFIGKII
jgi:flagellar biosynthesis/type III secretory pathway M-ring protein FliF/YscJ